MSEAPGSRLERRLGLLHASSLEIAQLRDVDDVPRRALALSLELTASTAGVLDLFDDEGSRRETIASEGAQVPERGAGRWEIGHMGIRTLLDAPLRVQGRVIGRIAVVDRPGGYHAEQARLLGAFADQVAVGN